MKINQGKQKLSAMTRIFYFVFGIIIASALIVYGINWNNPDYNLSMIGFEMNQWISAGIMVLIGILAGTMIKSAILGKNRLD